MMVALSSISEHASRKSCWVIIRGNVYDLTSFLDSHPAGPMIILKHAGKDATKLFESVHPSDTLEKFLTPEQRLGPVTEDAGSEAKAKSHTEVKRKPPASLTSSLSHTASSAPRPVRLSSIINIRDFEEAASRILPRRSFAFFKAGAEDEHTAQWNRDSWRAIRFRPRVLRPIPQVDISTAILGTKFSAPFFISPAGGAKLAHPSGDLLLSKAAGQYDILHWVCNNAGFTQQEIVDVRGPAQTLFWQIYAVHDLAITEAEVRQAVASGFKGFALTVDAIRPGKRERDIRVSLEEEQAEDEEGEDGDESDEGFASGPTVKRAHVWQEFDWDSAIKWLRGITDLPIAIKGIQSWEDAALCMHYGVHPWLSNHAGRQLEGAPSAADTLVAIRRNAPEVFQRCEVIVDGGVTRGADIVKALALGAKGVGLGRGFLYSLVYGQKGISKAIQILKHEMETTMALLGVTEISQLSPSYVDTAALDFLGAMPRARL